MTADRTEERGDGPPEEWDQYVFDPSEDEIPPQTRWTLDELLAQISWNKSTRNDIAREIKASGITFPEVPDWQDYMMADYSECRSAPRDIAQLFFRLGMIMSEIFHLEDHLNRLLITRQRGAAGSEKAKVASLERRDTILTLFAEVLANDPDARKLPISRLAIRLESLLPPEASGFSAGSIRRALHFFENDVVAFSAEPRFASLPLEERIARIIDVKGNEAGYSIETIRFILKS
jgi:hypothetical protein